MRVGPKVIPKVSWGEIIIHVKWRRKRMNTYFQSYLMILLDKYTLFYIKLWIVHRSSDVTRCRRDLHDCWEDPALYYQNNDAALAGPYSLLAISPLKTITNEN